MARYAVRQSNTAIPEGFEMTTGDGVGTSGSGCVIEPYFELASAYQSCVQAEDQMTNRAIHSA
jgi:hypothetical protein